MVDYPAGSASITMAPSFKTFVDKAKAELKSIKLQAEVQLTPNTGEAEAKIEGVRASAERDINTKVIADTTEADAEIDGMRKRQESKPVKLPVEVDKSSRGKLSSDVGKMVRDLRGAASFNLKVLGVDGAAGAMSSILSIADAAAKASQAVLAIPSIGFGGAAGIGAAAVGINGLPGAFKAISAESKNSAGNAVKQQDAIDGVAEAEYRVGEAQASVGTAARELATDQADLNDVYKDASRNLRDVNLSLKEQKLSVGDAAIAVREAAVKLQESRHNPRLDADQRQKEENDYQRTILRLEAQQNKEKDLQSDTAEANTKGVEGSKTVVAAKQKIADAAAAEAKSQHEVTQAYVGLRKAQDATKSAGGQDKVAAAFDQLSPNAKQLVTDIRSLGPAWTEARKASQDALTDGAGPAVKDLANAQLPNLRAGLVGINRELNTGLRASMKQLGTESSQLDFRTSLRNTEAGFAGLAGAAAPVTHTMTTLVTVGTSFFPQWGDGIDGLSRRVDTFVTKSAASGVLADKIREGDTAIKDVGIGVEHVGSIIGSVFRAAGDGGSSLKTFDDVAGHLAGTLKSVSGQDKLASFFSDARSETEKLQPILADIPALLRGVTEGVREWSDITMPFLRAAGDLLREHPILIEGAITAYAGFKTVKPFVDGAQIAIKALGRTAAGEAASTGGAGKFRTAGAGLIGLLGNPWTAALTVAGGAVVGFAASANKGAEAVQRMKDESREAITANEGIIKALRGSGGNVDDTVVGQTEVRVKQLRDSLQDGAKDAPGFWDKLVGGASGVFANLTKVRSNSILGTPTADNAGIGAGIAQNEKFRESIDSTAFAAGEGLAKLGFSDQELARKISGSQPEFDGLVGHLRGIEGDGSAAEDKLRQLREEFDFDKQSAKAVSDSIGLLGEKNRDAATDIDAATNALERQRQGGLTLENAQLRVNEALTGLKHSADDGAAALTNADGSIVTTTKSGQELYGQIQSLAPAWEQVTSAAYNHAIQEGKTKDEALAAAQKVSEGVKGSAEQQIISMGLTKTAADELLAHYIPLSKDFKATFSVDVNPAIAALEQLRRDIADPRNTATRGLLQMYANNITPPAVLKPQQQQLSPLLPDAILQPHAAGGPIAGGTPGKDSVPLLGMPGEHMLTTGDVDRLGGQEGVYRFRAALAAGQVGKYAAGGAVGADQTKVNAAAGRVQALNAFAASRNGASYVLGGPEDCSGFQSELANIAVGLAPNSGRMATSNEGPWLQALNFQLGTGGPGSFRIGWIDDPSMPGGGHTAGTFPSGTNVESNGDAGVQYGGAALGANAAMFVGHAYLQMGSGVAAAPGAITTPDSSSVSTQSVTYPQAPAVGRRSESQITGLTDKAAVDDANSQRNKVYADTSSSPQDKLNADLKLESAQNTLEESQKKGKKGDKDSELLSLPGFLGSLGEIVGTGILSSLGLENSILSPTNPWNKAIGTGVDALAANAGPPGTLGGYGYVPENLPSIVTTVTEQPGANGTAPSEAAVPVQPGDNGTVEGKVKAVMADRKWNVGSEWDALDQLVGHESSWSPIAQNPESTAYGLFQFLDETWGTVGAVKTSDPTAQARAGEKYIQNRYGDPEAAWSFWQAQSPHWYDDGGEASGVGLMMKNVIRPERVLNPSNTETFNSVLPLLESINATTGGGAPSAINSAPFAAPGADGGGKSYDHSISIGNVQTFDVESLRPVIERIMSEQAMAHLGAY